MYILFYKSYAHNNSLSSQNKGSFPHKYSLAPPMKQINDS